jgi:indolepyruvate ferredoxin oxidoreductase
MSGGDSAPLELSDRYRRETGEPVFLTGVEAIVRLLLDKQRADRDAGRAVNETFVTGYEGSPLGGLDLKVLQQLDVLNELGRTVHQFGINEKTAASAILGSQYAPQGNVDAFWYGKAHGTMWIPDEAWLANLTGAARNGSMVLLCGEDHRSKSSVSPGTSDWALRAAWVPTFYPATVEEVLTLGAHAVALSRWLGVVTALKLVTPVCDGGASVRPDAARIDPLIPDPAYAKSFHPIVMALGALPMQRELVEAKTPLVEQYVHLNGLNRSHWVDSGGSLGIVTTGKSVVDVQQALDLLGLRLPVHQLSVTWPVDAAGVRRFAEESGVEEILVVEEPGPFVEDAVRSALWGTQVRRVVGERDEAGAPLVPSWGEVDPEVLARLLADRLGGRVPASGTEALERIAAIDARPVVDIPRVVPMSCGGCPYNSFRALGGEKPGGAIGCSSIRAMEAYDKGVRYIPTMGAGGSIHSGTAPFNGNEHIFQYLGDGSYFHSGRGAVQSCVQGDVNITFLLLYNGAVALTGGQQPGGQRTVPEVAAELLALGVREVGVVGDEPRDYGDLTRDRRLRRFPLAQHEAAIEHYRQAPGTTVLILDKECATEKGRRRRRAGQRPGHYVFIHEEICEGCGDCLRQSEGCAALISVDTELGDKRQVRQAHCVQDELCLDGECPSFLTVTPVGEAALARRHPEPLADLPEPDVVPLAEGESRTLLAVGRGGTGVVTISHIVAWAAQRDGLSVYLSNNTGLAQKGGPVEAPMRLARGDVPAFHRLVPGSADLLLGFDLLRASEAGNLRYASPGRTRAVVSTTRVPTADLNRNPERRFPDPEALAALIDRATSKEGNVYVDSYWLAEQLFADVLFANMILLGAAFQAGHLPVRGQSLEAVIRLNGKAVDDNLQAFRWGRLAVADPKRLQVALGAPRPDAGEVVAEARARLAADPAAARLLDELLTELALSADGERVVAHRVAELVAWQDTAWAARFAATLRRVRAAERSAGGGEALSLAAARGLHRLMTYKDEYEVARLMTDGASLDRIRALFDGAVRVDHHLHPPSLRGAGVGKLRLGGWIRPPLAVLARLKGLRGGALDPFGRTACRRLERELVGWYEGVLQRIADAADRGTPLGDLTRIAEAVDDIRGFEQVKIDAARRVRARVDAEVAALSA